MKVEIFDDMAQCTEDEVLRMLPLVSAQRRAQALEYRFLSGRFACLKAAVMLQDMLVSLGYLEPGGCVEFEYGEYGKPFLKGCPDIHFNISHCPLAIAVAVADHPVGIDIERFHNPDEALLLKTMNDSERQLIASSPNPDEAFTCIWTQKEAFLKMRGTGLVDDLRWVTGTGSLTQINKEKQYAYNICENILKNNPPFQK